jgi:hypothetical protein
MYPLDRNDVLPPTLVTGVVEHEYFKFQVQKQVETQVQDYLMSRTKVLGTIGTLVLTFMGVLGVQKYLSLTSMVDEAQTKFAAVSQQIVTAQKLAVDAQNAMDSTKPLLDLARANVDSSRAISEGAGATARQTSDLARAVLDQVHTTQADVRVRSDSLKSNLDAASQTIARLNEQQANLESITKQVEEIKGASDAIAARRREIDVVAKDIKKISDALTTGLDFQRQLAMVRTFEIVLLRDGHSVELTLPDFHDVQSHSPRQYRLRIEAKRIKDDVDFRIVVNGREPAAAFDRFTRSQSAPIPETPFEVRVDSIYHAKLAYDFVLLRINPIDDRAISLAAAPTPPDPGRK